jgi:hypothetical protein
MYGDVADKRVPRKEKKEDRTILGFIMGEYEDRVGSVVREVPIHRQSRGIFTLRMSMSLT